MSNGPACSPVRLEGAITPATSPSPKLDSTPAMCTSASGQSWRTMPLMNVPWPASKSSVPLPSSSGSSSSSMASTGVVFSQGDVQLGAPEPRVLDDRTVAAVGAQTGVEHEDLRSSVPVRASATAAGRSAPAPPSSGGPAVGES